jgi:hypothetical protein
VISLRVTVKGDRTIIEGLRDLRQRGLPDAVDRGLGRAVREASDEAYTLLSGPGRKRVRTRRYRGRGKTRTRGQFDMTGGRQGSYPVPVLTGHLRREQGYVLPGATVSAGGEVFTAMRGEAILFNAAEYADVIHDGTFSSEPFGPRPYQTDAIMAVNVVRHIEAEVDKELPK